MLPRGNKLARSADFRRVMRKGGRAGTRTVVVHYFTRTGEVAVSGPRFGLVVSKQVGNAVTRHQVSRRLRHVLMGLIPELEASVDIVVRALPPAAEASSKQLLDDVSSAIPRAKKKAHR